MWTSASSVTLAASFIWLCLRTGAALGQAPLAPAAPPPETPAAQVLRALCQAQGASAKPLSNEDAAACRQLWQDDIAAARKQQETFQQQAIARRDAAKAGFDATGPVPLSRFIGDDSLTFGDIIMIDDGPRVYVGRSYELAKAEDFVTLDAPRSPHRKRAAELLRALKR